MGNRVLFLAVVTGLSAALAVDGSAVLQLITPEALLPFAMVLPVLAAFAPRPAERAPEDAR